MNDYKPLVLFPYVEAGLGHIMPMHAIVEAFSEKYGEFCNVQAINFYDYFNDESMLRYKKLLVSEVNKYDKNTVYGYACNYALHVFGKHLSIKFILDWLIPHATENSVKSLESIKPDLVFSTHWATAYYVSKMKDKPINMIFCPDAKLDVEWQMHCDLTLISVQSGVTHAIKKLHYTQDNIKCVPFLMRKQAYSVNKDKIYNRKLLGFDENKFTVVLADGAYGSKKLHALAKAFLKSKLNINLVVVCGKNEKIYNDLITREKNPDITFYPIKYTDKMLEIMASADIFLGKSGACSMAEACFFAVPMIITYYATPIEANIAKYYVKQVGCAKKTFSPKKAITMVDYLMHNKRQLQKMSDNAKKMENNFGAEKSADLIWKMLVKKFPHLKDKN